jgi:hypothetical protein
MASLFFFSSCFSGTVMVGVRMGSLLFFLLFFLLVTLRRPSNYLPLPAFNNTMLDLSGCSHDPVTVIVVTDSAHSSCRLCQQQQRSHEGQGHVRGRFWGCIAPCHWHRSCVFGISGDASSSRGSLSSGRCSLPLVFLAPLFQGWWWDV